MSLLTSTFIKKPHNFYGGPGALPVSVLEEAKKNLFNYRSTGLSVMELSHRSPQIVDLIGDTVERFKVMMRLDHQWELVLLQGGATTQFIMVPYNLSKPTDNIDYLDTGYWSQKAIREVQRCRPNMQVIDSGAEHDYQRLPCAERITPRENSRYLHICSNNTVHGTQWHEFPASNIPLVLDASSDLLSKHFDLSNVNCIYAHAQKNAGLAGVTVVAVRKKALIEDPDMPYFFDYQSHIDARSNYHTPPVFSIYITNLMLRWLETEMGGIDAIAAINAKKAQALYQAIDHSKLFKNTVFPEHRSKMNVTFTTGNESLDQTFIDSCGVNSIIGIAGHRSQKMMRASIYNAVNEDDVTALIAYMEKFEQEITEPVASPERRADIRINGCDLRQQI